MEPPPRLHRYPMAIPDHTELEAVFSVRAAFSCFRY